MTRCPFDSMAVATWRHKQNSGPKPWPVALYDQCRLFSALPRSGGILDQDSFETTMIEHVLFISYLAGFTSEIKASKELMPKQLELWKKLKAAAND